LPSAVAIGSCCVRFIVTTTWCDWCDRVWLAVPADWHRGTRSIYVSWPHWNVATVRRPSMRWGRTLHRRSNASLKIWL
jgi:hypothetical protein